MKFQLSQDKKAIVVTSLLIGLVLVLKALFHGKLGQIGPDLDDSMRLVQVRDLLAGQSWFDTTQYRMGPDGGTVMHWSRLVDLPILILISFFELFLPATLAESLAITIWPLITIAMTVYGVVIGIRHVSGVKTLPVICLLIFLMLISYFKFEPGAIDHHNIQVALLAIAVGHALDPERLSRSYKISALCLAISLAIGPEVYPFIAVLCGFFALQWLFDPVNTARSTQSMGFTFALALAIIFFATTSPQNYGAIYCDSFSLITFLACSVGGIGLGLSAFFISNKSFFLRLSGLIALAVLCLIIFVFQAPQCISNPLEALPEDVQKLWLSKIDEAQPLFADPNTRLARAPYALGPAFIALIYAGRRLFKGEDTYRNGLLLVFLTVSMGLTIYQYRFTVFSHIAALFVLGPWVVKLFVEGQSNSGSNIKYLAAVVVSIPMFWGFPGSFFPLEEHSEQVEPKPKGVCYSKHVFDTLNTLEPGLLIAVGNDTPKILMKTHHRALGGNYHRNVEGISDMIKILRGSADQVEPLLRKHGADYVYVCSSNRSYTFFKDNYPEGLVADLIDSETPVFMELIRGDLENGAVKIYRVLN